MYFHPRILPPRMHARRIGSGPAVICLHSSGSSSAQWREFAGTLARDHRVIAPDLLGHGRSAAPVGSPATVLAQDAAQVEALAAEHGAVDLVGHSYGAAVALRVALARPEHVRSLALYEPVVFGLLRHASADAAHWEEIGQAGRRFASSTRRNQVLAAGRDFVDFWSGAGRWRALGAERQWAVARRMPTIVAHFESLFGWAADGLATLTQPVLLMHGNRTRAVAARVAVRLGERLRNVLPATVGGAGHMGPVTHAAAVNAQIAAFLRGRASLAPVLAQAA